MTILSQQNFSTSVINMGIDLNSYQPKNNSTKSRHTKNWHSAHIIKQVMTDLSWRLQIHQPGSIFTSLQSTNYFHKLTISTVSDISAPTIHPQKD